MTAVERVVQAVDARRLREGEYRGRCPVHQGKSATSLSIKDVGDKVLIFCHAGCRLEDILSALGIRSAAELFNSVRQSKPDLEAQRQARIVRGLEIWCERRFIVVYECLRELDFNISLTTAALARYEDGTLPRDPIEEAEWWDLLARAYKLRSDLEYEFEILIGRDLQAKYDEVYRRLK